MAHKANLHHRRGARRPTRGRALALERLESRQVLSANAYIYGIADNNTIWEIDVAARTSRGVFDAKPVIGSGNSNAFAYDNSRSQFFFIDPQNQLQFWDRGSSLTVLATHDELGLASKGSQPCNAAYHDDAYWYFTDGTNVLNKVSFTYTADGIPEVAGRETFVVNGAPTLTNTFGDIAIDGKSGILYASNTNGAFYAVNLAAPETGFTLIKDAVDESPGLQLSFDTDYGVLYGQSFTGGQWYTVNTTTGENTPIIGFNTIVNGINGLRDIGGSADMPVVEADLTIAKTDGVEAYVPGRAVTYTITVTNGGPVAVSGARVRDVLPEGTSFVSATGGAAYDAATNTVRYTAGALATGGSASFTLTILPSASRAGTLVNTATVTTPAGVIDSDPTNNSATDTDSRLSPVDLSITKTDGTPNYVPGRNTTYTITVGNAGPSAVSGAIVSDVLPAGTTFVSATGGATYNTETNTVSLVTGMIAVGGTTSFTLTILPAATRVGSLANTATVTAPAGTFDLNSANNSATDTDTPTPIADLFITKTDGTPSYVPGQNTTYTITVGNTGPSAVTGAIVSDILPAGTTFVSATGGATYNAGTNTVSLVTGTIAVGGTTSFTLTILPAADRSGDLVNTASVATPLGTSDPTPGNNSATDTDSDKPDSVILAVSDVGCESTPMVTVIDAATGTVRTKFQAFETGFRGGIRAALGDLDNDGIDEVVAATGPGRTAEIRVFTLEGVERTGFRLLPFGSSYRDGVEVAVGDVNGDGNDDVVATRSRGAGEVVILRSTGTAIRQAAAFTAFSSSVTGGAVVAVADMGTFAGATDRRRLDGRAEVLVGSGTGTAPIVMVFDVSGAPRVVDSFRPLSAAYQAGFSVAVQRINSDLIPDIVVAAGRSAATTVAVYDGVSKANIATYQAFASLAKGAARAYAAAADIDGDGYADEVYMTQGMGGAAAGVQRLRVQTPSRATAIATSEKGPLRIVARGPRRVAA